MSTRVEYYCTMSTEGIVYERNGSRQINKRSGI